MNKKQLSPVKKGRKRETKCGVQNWRLEKNKNLIYIWIDRFYQAPQVVRSQVRNSEVARGQDFLRNIYLCIFYFYFIDKETARKSP